jgi:HAD superfamily hydrolase (TIGR01549 family)
VVAGIDPAPPLRRSQSSFLFDLDGTLVDSVYHHVLAWREALEAEDIKARSADVQPLPGARELLTYLTRADIPWTIATSGRLETAGPVLERLGVDLDRIPVVTRDQVKYAKPDPDLFLTAAERLNVDIATATVVGDSVWDMLASRRARALGIGLLSGGYGQDELQRAGAYRVYEDPADMLNHIDEVAARP